MVLLELDDLLISIHALREEGDRTVDGVNLAEELFLSTPSARRATVAPPPLRGVPDISIHALREEGDVLRTAMCRPVAYFYPRPPRGGRRVARAVRAVIVDISIHALREEGDLPDDRRGEVAVGFLSTPSARRATAYHAPCEQDARFLSTPSARRATRPRH